MLLFLPREFIAPGGARSARQQATVKQTQTHTFSGLEKSPRYNVGHKLGLRVRPTSNNNHIYGKLWTMYLRW